MVKQVQRRLAAILAADVVGFSSLMERDEEGTYARIGLLRRELIEPRLAEHQGRLIKTTGDGFLVEFASPIAALRCAMAVQDELGNNQVRCLAMGSTDGLVRGAPVVNTGRPITVPVGEGTLGRIFNVLGETIDSDKPVEAAAVGPYP